jgi:DAK2 domain fusion protein YloV
MFVSKRFIDGTDLTNMIFSGAQILQSQVKIINGLNVFPVPDGDTGTNMNMTLNSGIDMLKKNSGASLSQAADVFAKGLLMGARGNSGVILSQLFRGFAKSLAGLHQADSHQFSAALQQGVTVAYEAVVKPVEGTILTVSREAAQHGVMMSKSTDDMVKLMRGILDQAKETLSKTPDLLPILKQAGVIDSGGQGLVFIYEGFCNVLEQKNMENVEAPKYSESSTVGKVSPFEGAQAHFETNEIEFPYDMEFFIHMNAGEGRGVSFELDNFRKKLAKNGDSILVIQDEEIVKVHVHTKEPGEVLNLALGYGELSKFHIENMRDQHRAIVDEPQGVGSQLKDKTEAETNLSAAPEKLKSHGFVAIAIGDGISDIFKSLGVDHVLFGGQTMNPSTEDIVESIRQVQAETIFVLPNNSNIILAAKQARDLVDPKVIVIPTVSIPQGIAAMFAYQNEIGVEENTAAMEQAAKEIKSGQVTYAVRDSKFDEIDIKSGDFIGIYDGKIVASEKDMITTSKSLLHEMISEDDEIVTILVGGDTSTEQSNDLLSFVEENYPEMEIETHRGGQPLYSFIFSVE